jgi:predicted Rdx family selenoprotein
VDEILARHSYYVKTLTLIPASHGKFEVRVDDALLFSKLSLNRHAEPGEIALLLEHELGLKPMPLPEDAH